MIFVLRKVMLLQTKTVANLVCSTRKNLLTTLLILPLHMHENKFEKYSVRAQSAVDDTIN
jgi:hypothetical protein